MNDNLKQTYKFSRFNNIISGGSYLIHNTMHDTCIRVNDADLIKYVDSISDGHCFEVDYKDEFQAKLIDLKLLVASDVNEIAYLNSCYFTFENTSELSLTMVVTRRCNFKCPYCYEEQINADMSDNIFENTSNFILNMIKEKHFRTVYISFFGGEPTLMTEKIIRFMKNLLSQNSILIEPAEIRATMTTNGYLLLPNVIRDLINVKVTHYQITVDGMASEHNKSRILSDGSGTWNRIIENIETFKEYSPEKVTVLLRSNLTPAILNNLDEWFHYLSENFNHPVFRFHFEAAKNFGFMNQPDFKLIENEKDTISVIVQTANKYKLALDMIGFRTRCFSMVCYAARQFHYLIDYDATVKKCTSSPLDEDFNSIGFLNNGSLILNNEKASQWTSYDLSERCYSCPILALCYMRKCPFSKFNHTGCDSLINSYYLGLKYKYN